MIVNIVSPIGLEPWGPDNPWTKGIGGSETSHIVMAKKLEEAGYIVHNYAPVPEDNKYPNWFPLSEFKPDQPGLTIVYRDPKFFDQDLPKDNKYWFIAQDVDYAWTDECLAKVHRYITLCPVHNDYTIKRYPQIRERVFVSSNGVLTENIQKLQIQIMKDKVKRDPFKFVYTSSPDRGLVLLLENWFRILERVPEAQVHVFYGLNNALSILEKGGSPHLHDLILRLNELKNQPGVIWRERVPQQELWREYMTANVWWYPTDWPETSCISSMEAQACGAIPVTSDYWALKQNVQFGFKTEGIPQDDPLAKIEQISYACDLVDLACSNETGATRNKMMTWAQSIFNWDKFVKQWSKWLAEDGVYCG